MKAYAAKGVILNNKDAAIFYNGGSKGILSIGIENENQAIKVGFDIEVDETDILIGLYNDSPDYVVDFCELPRIVIGVETLNIPDEDEEGRRTWSKEFDYYDTKIDIDSLSPETQKLIEDKMIEIIDDLNA